MIKVFKIRTIDREVYVFPINRIHNWNLEYNPQIARFDFKDGTFIEFTRQYIICISTDIVEGEAEC